MLIVPFIEPIATIHHTALDNSGRVSSAPQNIFPVCHNYGNAFANNFGLMHCENSVFNSPQNFSLCPCRGGRDAPMVANQDSTQKHVVKYQDLIKPFLNPELRKLC